MEDEISGSCAAGLNTNRAVALGEETASRRKFMKLYVFLNPHLIMMLEIFSKSMFVVFSFCSFRASTDAFSRTERSCAGRRVTFSLIF